MVYQFAQRFNNGKASNYQVLDTDSATMQGLIALAPKGQTVFNPTATGAVGTVRAVPVNYVEALAVCFDKVGSKFNSSFLNIKFGKNTLSDDDIRTACLGVITVPNGTSCDSVNIKKFKMV